MNERLLTAKEAAELTGLHAATIRKMAWQRHIRSFKVLGALRFKQSDLEALIVERPALDEQTEKHTKKEQLNNVTSN